MKYVTELLKDGAPVNWSDGEGQTALHWACGYKRAEVVKVLLIHNPQINKKNTWGNTALHKACWRGYLDCVKLLLATGQCNLGWCESVCVTIDSIGNFLQAHVHFKGKE